MIGELELTDALGRVGAGLVDIVDQAADAATTEEIGDTAANEFQAIDTQIGPIVDIRGRGIQAHAANDLDAVEFQWSELVLATRRQARHEDVGRYFPTATLGLEGRYGTENVRWAVSGERLQLLCIDTGGHQGGVEIRACLAGAGDNDLRQRLLIVRGIARSLCGCRTFLCLRRSRGKNGDHCNGYGQAIPADS
jgi:hypothetical protein